MSHDNKTEFSQENGFLVTRESLHAKLFGNKYRNVSWLELTGERYREFVDTLKRPISNEYDGFGIIWTFNGEVMNNIRLNMNNRLIIQEKLKLFDIGRNHPAKRFWIPFPYYVQRPFALYYLLDDTMNSALFALPEFRYQSIWSCSDVVRGIDKMIEKSSIEISQEQVEEYSKKLSPVCFDKNKYPTYNCNHEISPSGCLAFIMKDESDNVLGIIVSYGNAVHTPRNMDNGHAKIL